MSPIGDGTGQGTAGGTDVVSALKGITQQLSALVTLEGSENTGPAVSSVFGRTGMVVAAAHDYNATQIDYTSPATDADLRTLASKLDEVVSVKDFGAVGDGSTDDSEAIQDAINWVVAAGGGRVFFPTSIVSGVAQPYRASNLSVTGNYVWLVGDGSGARIDCNNVANNIITFSGVFGCGLCDLQLSSRSLTMNAGTAALAITNCNQFNADRFIIDGSDGTAVAGGHVDQGVLITHSSGYYVAISEFRINFCNSAAIITAITTVIDLNITNGNIGGQWGGSLTAGNATKNGVQLVQTGTNVCGSVFMDNVHVISVYGFGISLSGNAPGKIELWMSNCVSDTCGRDDYNFLNCGSVRMVNCWAGACTGNVAISEGAGIVANNVDPLFINNCEGADFNGAFIFVTGGSTNVVIANNISLWGNNSNTTFGGLICAGIIVNATNFTVVGNVINNTLNASSHYKYGCNVTSAAGPGGVGDNQFNCETGPVLVSSGAGRNVRVHDNGSLYTVTNLTAQLAAGNCAGSHVFVSDSSVTTFANVVSGGGTSGVPVYSEGTNWFVG